MKKCFLTMAISTMVVGLILSGAPTITDTGSTTMVKNQMAQSIYTARFRVATEISPGGNAAAGLPEVNTWGFDSWVFMAASVPCFPRAEVELETDVVAGDYVPVLTFTPSPGWTLVEEEYGSIWRSVWMLSTPMEADGDFPPLFHTWHMTNFRVRNGVCGEHSYAEITAAMNRATIQRYSLQADGIDGTAMELWRMVKGNER